MFQDRLSTSIYHRGVGAWNVVKDLLCPFLRVRSQLELLSHPPVAKQKRRVKLVATSPSQATNPDDVPLPRFIPLTRKSPKSSEYVNSKIYPEIQDRYPFSNVDDVEPPGEEQILTKGYARLKADQKYKNILQHGENGRLSFIGMKLPDGTWTALF